MMVILMVNACMQNEGENYGEFVVEHVHDDRILCIQNEGDYDVFVAS